MVFYSNNKQEKNINKPPEHFRNREIKRCWNCIHSDNGVNECTKHKFCYQDFSEIMCESVCDDWNYRWKDEREFKKDKHNALTICSPVDAEKGAELRHRIASEQDATFMRETSDQANDGIDGLALDDDQTDYVVHYKWQEGAELFFNREIIKDFTIKNEDALTKLENRLCVILSNCGMEEEQLATVQITGITQL